MRAPKIIDKFLPRADLKGMDALLNSPDFDWYYVKNINSHSKKDDLGVYFIHNGYHQGKASRFMHIFSPILTRLDIKSLIRIKVNLYPRTPKLEVHSSHADFDYSHTGAIFYLNTNNGKTILEDGTQIDSVANRILLFDASTKHSSTSTTNTKVRINININYQ